MNGRKGPSPVWLSQAALSLPEESLQPLFCYFPVGVLKNDCVEMQHQVGRWSLKRQLLCSQIPVALDSIRSQHCLRERFLSAKDKTSDYPLNERQGKKRAPNVHFRFGKPSSYQASQVVQGPLRGQLVLQVQGVPPYLKDKISAVSVSWEVGPSGA